MNELTKTWIDALRSGKYRQGQGVLRTRDNGFCCLGVLCDIVDTDSWKVVNVSGEEKFDSTFGSDSISGFPKQEVLDLVGMSFEDAETLADLNDNGCTFDFIASDIERWSETGVFSCGEEDWEDEEE